MRRLLFMAACIAALWTTAGQAVELSFDEARALVQDRSDALHAADAESRRKEYDAQAAQALDYPEVSVSYTEIEGHKSLDLGTFPYLGRITKEADLGGPRSAVSVTWPIYTGGRISAAQQAKAAEAQAAHAEQHGTQERLDAELAQRYFSLRLAGDVESLRRAQFEQTERDLHRASEFEKQGQLSALERLSAQVARDEAEREYIKAGHNRATAEASLSRLLRSPTQVDARTPLFMHTRPLPALGDWLQMARDANPALAVLQAKQLAAAQGVLAAKGAYLPEVFAYGEYNLIKRNLSLTEPNWIAGLGVRINLFAREDRASAVGAARAQVERVDALRAEASNQIETAVEASWLRAEQAQRQFALYASSLDLARQNLHLRQRAFDEGQSTVLEVNDARNSLLRAQTGQAQIAYEFDIALIALLEVCGQSARYVDYIKTADVNLQP